MSKIDKIIQFIKDNNLSEQELIDLSYKIEDLLMEDELT